MSFEDDMIEEGFYDEQDYLDYLCAKADEDDDDRSRWAYCLENGELIKRDAGEVFRERMKLEAPLLEWKRKQSRDTKFWNYIYSRHCHVLDDEFHYWQLWRQSDQKYSEWKQEHKQEIRMLLKSLVNSFNKEFDIWLCGFNPRYFSDLKNFNDWKKENASLMPLFKSRFLKIRILDLWNEANPNNIIIIDGLND